MGEATSTMHGPLRIHEDEENELGLFWATKIGGPSHGFDVEAQCLLPLLANARHKVILVSDPEYKHHPVGRAHFRLLWTHNDNQYFGWKLLTRTSVHALIRDFGVMQYSHTRWPKVVLW